MIDAPLTLMGSDADCQGPSASGARAVLKPAPGNSPDPIVAIDLGSVDTVTLQSLEIRESIAGGGVDAVDAEVVLVNTSVTANVGSGVRIRQGSLTLVGSRIRNNHAYEGGGIHATHSSVLVDATSFVGGIHNVAQYQGGSLYLADSELTVDGTIRNGLAEDPSGYHGYGGCIAAIRSTLLVRGDGILDGCSATSDGGAFFLQDCDLTIEGDAQVVTGEAARGGLIYGSGSAVTLRGRARLADGTATDGGLVYLSGATSLFGTEDITLESGEASGSGGLVFSASSLPITLYMNTTLRNGVAGADGGLVYLAAGSLVAGGSLDGTTVTLSGGSAIDGAGIFAGVGSDVSLSDSLRLHGNIASGNGGGVFLSASAFSQTGSAQVGKEGSPNRALRGAGVHAANSDLYFHRAGYDVDPDNATEPLEGVRIEHNIATFEGGGLALYDSTVDAQGLVVARNRAYGSAALNEGDGGGAALLDGSLLEADNSIFFDNRARERGGGVYVADGTLLMNTAYDTGSNDDSRCRVAAVDGWYCSELRNNQAFRLNDPSDGEGGALFVETNGTVELTLTALVGNGAEASAPHAYVDGGAVTLTNTLAVDADLVRAASDGFRFEGSGRLTADHLTVGGQGATIDYVDGGSLGSLTHSIVWANGFAGSGLLLGGGFLTGSCNVGAGVGGLFGGNNVSNADPQFVGFYHVDGASPAADLCSTTEFLDLDLLPRPSGLDGDSGAFEFQAP